MMVQRKKSFWLGLCFINLWLVALMGVLLRSKILFSITFVNYKNFLNAHSHLAFSGWVGLAFLTFFIYDVLPQGLSGKQIYEVVLWTVEISSLGMAVSFPFKGYAFFSILFSTLFILATYVFGWRFFKDIRRLQLFPPVRWLSVASVASLLLSSVGPFGLAYFMITKSGNSLLYRDIIYTFLHLQYNGFFALGVFALFFHALHSKGFLLPKAAKWFSLSLIASVLPSLFLSLLWHNLPVFYVFAIIGCLFVLLSLLFFIPFFRALAAAPLFTHRLAKVLWIASSLSFIIKTVLTAGTIYPPLGNAVFGARPVIIGFLHLVFLGFVSFFIVSKVLEDGLFDGNNRLVAYPFYIFGAGVVINEVLLMLQGLEVLLQTSSPLYNWLLWIAAIVLFSGASSMVATFYTNKKATVSGP